jgi:Cdc6-like AAA superfamily ATPase
MPSNPHPQWSRNARSYVGNVTDAYTLTRARQYVHTSRLLVALTEEDFDLLDQLDDELDKRALLIGTLELEAVG